jgi:hypothetical protein
VLRANVLCLTASKSGIAIALSNSKLLPLKCQRPSLKDFSCIVWSFSSQPLPQGHFFKLKRSAKVRGNFRSIIQNCFRMLNVVNVVNVVKGGMLRAD